MNPDDGRLGGDASATADASGAADASANQDGSAVVTPGLGDPDRCGPTEARCSVEELCVGERCVCRPEFTALGDRCVDLSSDPRNCGVAGNTCERGVCSGGRCEAECGGGLRRCDQSCVSDSDIFNCGECGRSCDRDEVCVDGECRGYDPLPCLACPCDQCQDRCCELAGGTLCTEADACPPS